MDAPGFSLAIRDIFTTLFGPHFSCEHPMAHVVFLMLPEGGHLMPTFKLARELRAAAHQVTFFTIRSLLDLVRSNGFTA